MLLVGRRSVGFSVLVGGTRFGVDWAMAVEIYQKLYDSLICKETSE